MKKTLLILPVLLISCIISYAQDNHRLVTNGQFWGLTYAGGDSGGGVVFKYDTNAKNETVVQNLYSPGINPYGSLIQANDGNFYGMTSGGGISGSYGTIFKLTPSGTISTLVNFDGTDGFWPYGSLIQGYDSNLWHDIKRNNFQMYPIGCIYCIGYAQCF